jgi:hypothetical protein
MEAEKTKGTLPNKNNQGQTLRFPRISSGHCKSRCSLYRKRSDRAPRCEWVQKVRRGIENTPPQREHGYFPTTRTSRGRELQFKLLLSRALADQTLHE